MAVSDIEGLTDGYEKGETGAALEKQYHLPYEEIVRRVFAAVEAHAKEQNWLPFCYNMCDETRVGGDRAAASGPHAHLQAGLLLAADVRDLQREFQAHHGPDGFSPIKTSSARWMYRCWAGTIRAAMDMAKQLGKQIYLYNQGRDRYSFGVYQWSEMKKGALARFEWISHICHGYQYFDLDGRENDPGAVYFASDGVRPTLILVQAREGMNDFRYLQTLEHTAAKVVALNAPEAKQAAAEARAFLTALADRIALGDRRVPAWLNQDGVRAEAAAYMDRLLPFLPGLTAGSPPS